MNVAEYLAHRGWSRDGIIAELANRLDLVPGDAVYFTGSLVEGLANGLSDLDVYLVTDRSLDDRLTFANAVIMDVRGMTVDVEVFRPHELQTLLETVASHPADESRRPLATLMISPRQLKVLHNLCRAEMARPGTSAVEFSPPAVQAAVARILFDRSMVDMTALDLDILGALGEGDAQSAGPMLFSYFGLVQGCVLAMNEETNPGQKWRPRLLDRLRKRSPSYGLPQHTHAAVRRLLDNGYPVIEPRLADQYRYFRRMVHAANTVVPIGQAHFLAGDGIAPAAAAVTGGQRDSRSGDLLPELHLRTRLRYVSEGYTISNPRVDHVSHFDRCGFDLLTQFDGRNGVREAAYRLAAPLGRRPDEIEAGLSEVRSFLVHFGYI